MNSPTIKLIQELLKTDSTDIETLLSKYKEYESKVFAFQCADKDIESEREKELFTELLKRSNDPNDTFFVEFDNYNKKKIDDAFQELCQLYGKIMASEIKKVNMFEITTRLCTLNKDVYDKLCRIFDPTQIVLKLEKIQIVDYDGNNIEKCRFDLYQDILFIYSR